MFWRIALVFFVLLSAAPALAHDEDTFDPHYATPGLRLELSELPRTTASATPRYRLHADGFPPGVSFGLWIQDFGREFRLIASGLRVDESGNVMSSKPGKAGRSAQSNPIIFGPGPYPRGAAWMVALASVDRVIKAFAAVIPNPIVVRDGPCTVQLELVSFRGDRFVVTGAGFGPGNEIITESQDSGRVIHKSQRISADGLLPLEVISHETKSANHDARYSVTCESCKVTVNYKWGAPALVRR